MTNYPAVEDGYLTASDVPRTNEADAAFGQPFVHHKDGAAALLVLDLTKGGA
jgi:hypothetical protein